MAPRPSDYKKEVERYNLEKTQIKADAEALEATSTEANDKSAHLLQPLHRSEQAMALIQIAIALASITVLTRKKWLFAVAGTSAAVGVVLAGMAFFL